MLNPKDMKMISAIKAEDIKQIELLIKNGDADISFAMTAAIFSQKMDAFAALLKFSTEYSIDPDQDIENALLSAKDTINELETKWQ